MLLEEILAIEYFGNSLKQYLIFFILVIGSLALGKLVYLVFRNVFKAIAKKTKSEFDDILLNVLEKPLLLLIVIIGFYVGYSQLSLPLEVDSFFEHITRTLFTIAVIWFTIKLVDEVIEHYVTPLVENSETDLDDHLVPLLKKFLNVSLVIIGILIILSTFGVNVTSAVAGLGLGGLAVALAAQETLKNILGGVAILTDKPFKLKDWIEVDNFQGEVVEIGLRSTRLKTATGELVTVPNSVMASTPIIDYNKYRNRKITFLLSLVFHTKIEKIEQAKKIIRKFLEEDELVVKNTIEINFIQFANSSIDLDVRFEVQTNSGVVMRSIKDKLNTKIKKEFEKEKISFAYPTQTIHLEK